MLKRRPRRGLSVTLSVAQLFLNSYCAGSHSPKLKAPAGSLALPALISTASRRKMHRSGSGSCGSFAHAPCLRRARGVPGLTKRATRHDRVPGDVSGSPGGARNRTRAGPGDVPSAQPHRIPERRSRPSCTRYRRRRLSADRRFQLMASTTSTSAACLPTSLDRYLSAAQKISRLAVGSPVVRPAIRPFVLPLDLTQNDQLDGLPRHPRRHLCSATHFHWTANTRSRFDWRGTATSNISMGLNEPPFELLLDGQQIMLFHMARLPATGGQRPRRRVCRDDAALMQG